MNLQVNANTTAAITRPNTQISGVTAPLKMIHNKKYKIYTFSPSFNQRSARIVFTEQALHTAHGLPSQNHEEQSSDDF